MTEQYIYWTDQEVAMLRDLYPRGGILLCMKNFQYRTKSSVRYKIAALGLLKDFSLFDQQRFETSIRITPSCWIWEGQISKYGYGVFYVMAKPVGAHRHSFELYCKSIPEGMNICHRCDNTVCVNPDHLFVGTQKQNIQDMIAKGRHGLPGAKLTPENVVEIRLSTESTGELMRKFCITRSAISSIKRRKTWKHIL